MKMGIFNRQSNFGSDRTETTGTLREDPYAFLCADVCTECFQKEAPVLIKNNYLPTLQISLHLVVQ
jgi:hypothetical protein